MIDFFYEKIRTRQSPFRRGKRRSRAIKRSGRQTAERKATSADCDDEAADIKNLTGIDTSGYKNSVKANTIRHIEERHGENGQADSSMSNDSDIARMQYVIDNYDTLELLPKTSKEYKNSDNSTAKQIRYTKRIDGTYYLVEAVPDTNKKQLEVVSAYKNKAAEQQALIMQTENSVPPVDVRNVVADTASTDIISQNNNAVNSDFTQNAQNNAQNVQNTGAASYENAAHTVDLSDESGGYTMVSGKPNAEETDDIIASVVVDGANLILSGAEGLPSVTIEYAEREESADISEVRKAINDYFSGIMPEGAEIDVLPWESADASANTQNTAENGAQTAESDALSIKSDTQGGKLIRDAVSWRLSADEKRALDALAKMCGVNIKILPKLRDGTANGAYKDGTIYLALDADNKITAVFSHEITHYFEEAAPKAYAEYRKAVLGLLSERSGKSTAALSDEVITEYSESGVNLTRAEAENELVADYTSELLSDAEKIQEFMDYAEIFSAEQRTVTQRLIDAIRAFIDKMRQNANINSDIKARLSGAEETANILERMIAESARNSEKAQGKSSLRYSAESKSGGKYTFNIKTNDDIAKSFGITKLNDYVHVQKQVNSTLFKEGFFSDAGGRSRTVTNAESGMIVEITPKGIKETFGEKNYMSLGKDLKNAKLATMRAIPELIEQGTLTADNVQNAHNPNSSVRYAYIQSAAIIDNSPAKVRIAVRKAPQKNRFWVHQIDIIKSAENTPAGAESSKTGYQFSSTTDSITESGGDVKEKFSDLQVQTMYKNKKKKPCRYAK